MVPSKHTMSMRGFADGGSVSVELGENGVVMLVMKEDGVATAGDGGRAGKGALVERANYRSISWHSLPV